MSFQENISLSLNTAVVSKKGMCIELWAELAALFLEDYLYWKEQLTEKLCFFRLEDVADICCSWLNVTKEAWHFKVNNEPNSSLMIKFEQSNENSNFENSNHRHEVENQYT